MRKIKLKCEYGCGGEAYHQFGNGKWCCSSHHNKCPKVRDGMKGENHPMYGYKYTEESKRKMSENRKGKNNGHYGRKHSDETKKKWSKDRKGTRLKEESSFYGKHHSEKTKEILRKIKTGTKHTLEAREKMSKSGKGKKKSKEHLEKIVAGRIGKKHSEETKRELRIIAIKRLEERYGQIFPNYNPDSCRIIDDYGKEHGYNFQHAENGGEFYIKELGYWLDGYDIKRNVPIEVDEPAHFDVDGNLLERDIKRQVEIEKHLKCKLFIRIRIQNV